VLSSACTPPARDADFRASDALTSPGYDRAGKPEFAIIYFEEFREIHIYGNVGRPNVATVDLANSGTPALGLDVVVRVTLQSTDVNLVPITLTEDFPLFSQQLTPTPPATDPETTFGTLAGGTNPPGRLVHEVWFHGGDAIDMFENLTDVPSYANGGDGNDRLTGGDSTDELIGGDGNDVLSGEGGNDILLGGFGSDALFGGSGSDRLHVKATGNDADVNVLCGGPGEDELEGARLADNRLSDGDSDGSDDDPVQYRDLLIGFNTSGHTTQFEFVAPPDEVIENGDPVTDFDDIDAPKSVDVGC
jgi:hypothetical protein